MRLKRIKGHPSYWISDSGEVLCLDKGKYKRVKTSLTHGYKQVCINGCKYYISKLVMETFCPTDNKSLRVYHLDGNKQNNKLTNLRWATCSQVQIWARMLPENRARE